MLAVFAPLKRDRVCLFGFKNKKVDIIFLQETYSTKEIENSWKRQRKGPSFSHMARIIAVVS